MLFSGVHKMRKAAAQLESKVTYTGHSDISMAIFQDKCAVEAMQKVLQTKREADDSWVKWAEQEANAPVRELMLKMADLDAMSHKVSHDYMVQCDSYRKYYKHILKGEKMIDEQRKQTEAHHAKTSKLQKQVETSHKSSKPPDKNAAKKSADAKQDKKKDKHESLEMELAKALSLQEGAVYNLKTREQNHEQFKYLKVRDAWKMLSDAQIVYHSQSQLIADGRKKILELYTLKDYAMMTSYYIAQAQVESTAIITSLAEKLNMPKPNRRHSTETAAVSGEPGGHDMTYQTTYMGIPEMEDSSSDSMSPAGSRGGSQRSTTSSQSERPLPPLPPGGDSDEEEYVDPDQLRPSSMIRQSQGLDPNDPNIYLDLVGEANNQAGESVYEVEPDSYDRVWEASSGQPKASSPHYENAAMASQQQQQQQQQKGSFSRERSKAKKSSRTSQHELGSPTDDDSIHMTHEELYNTVHGTQMTYQDMAKHQRQSGARHTITEDTYEVT